MANRRIDVTLGVNADTSAARTQLQSLRTELNGLQSKALTVDDAGLKKAAESAKQLQVHLQNALNTNTGNIDLSKLDASLRRSKTNIQELGNGLLQAGAGGQQAFIKLSQSIASAEYPALRLSNTMKSFATTLMSTVKWQLSSSILHGFIGSIQQAYGYAKDLNDSLNDIRIVTGYNIETMDRFAESANRAAKKLSTSTLDYTKAALIYYQQGLGGKEIEERTNATVKMANVTGQAAQTVSDQMTAIWNNFDDGSKALEYYADVVTALGAATASSSDEIAQGLEKFAAVSETVGLSYEYATTALATVTAETRQSADVVGTAFKTLFSRIQGLKLGETLDDGTTLNKYSQGLASVGINIKDSNGQLKEMDEILDEMGAKWETLNKDQQVALAQTVGGIRQYNQLIALMDNWDTFKVNLEIANESEGTLEEQQKIYEESWEASSKRVKASMEELWNNMLNDDFFIGLNDGLTSVVEGLNNVIEGFGGIGNVIGTVAAIFVGAFANKIGPLFTNIKNNVVTMFVGTGKQIQGISNQTQSMLNKLDLNKFNTLGQQQLKNANALIGARAKLALVTKDLSDAERMESEQDLSAIQIEQQEAEAIAKTIQKRQEELQLMLANPVAMENSKSDIVKKQNIANNRYDSQLANLDPLGDEYGILSKKQLDFEVATEQLNIVLDQQTQKMSSVYVQAEKIRSSNPAEAARLEKDALNELNQAYITYLQSAEQRSNEKDFSAITSSAEAFGTVINKIKGDTTQLKAALQKAKSAETFEEAQAAMRQARQELERLVNESGELGVTLKGINPQQFNNIKKNLTETELETQRLTEKQEALNKAYKDFQPTHIMTGVEMIGKIAGMAGQMSMVLSSFNSLKAAFSSDPDTSFTDRAMNGLMGISMLIPGLIGIWGSYTKIVTSAGFVQRKLNKVQADSLNATLAEIAAMDLKAMKLAYTNGLSATELGIIGKGAKKRKEKLVTDIQEVATMAMKNNEMTTEAIQQELINRGLEKETAGKIANNIATERQEKSQKLLNKQKLISYGYIGLIIAAIAALVVIIGLIVKASMDAYNADKIAAEAAQKNVEDLSKRYEELTEEVKKFKEEVSNYDEAVDALKDLKEGTKEYNEALEKANENAKNLIETYKLYGKFSYNSKGLIVFDEGVLENAEREKEKQLNELEVSLNRAKIDSEKATLQYKYTQVSRESSGVGRTKEEIKEIAETFNKINSTLLSDEELYSQLSQENIKYASILVDNRERFQELADQASKAADAIEGLQKEITKSNVEDVFGERIDKIVKDKETGEINQGQKNLITEIMANSQQESGNEDKKEKEIDEAYAVIKEYESYLDYSNADVEDFWNSNKIGGKELKDLAASMGITSMNDTNTYKLLMAQRGYTQDQIDQMHFDNQNGKVVVKLDGEEIYSNTDKQARKLLMQESAIKAIEEKYKTNLEKDKGAQIILEATEKLINNSEKLQEKVGIDTNQLLSYMANKENGIDFSGSLNQDQAHNLLEMSNSEILETLGISKEALLTMGFTVDSFTSGLRDEANQMITDMSFILNSGNADLSSLMTEYAKDFSKFTVQQAQKYRDYVFQVYSENGIEGAKRAAKLIDKHGIDKFLEFESATSELDWGSAGLEDVREALKEAGIEGNFTEDAINDLANVMKLSADSGTIFINKLKTIDELLSESLKQGDSITEEQYSQLSENLQGYFIQMLDGTYKLIAGAYEFNQALNVDKINAIRQNYIKQVEDQEKANQLLKIKSLFENNKSWDKLYHRTITIIDNKGKKVGTYNTNDISKESTALTLKGKTTDFTNEMLANEALLNSLSDGKYKAGLQTYTWADSNVITFTKNDTREAVKYTGQKDENAKPEYFYNNPYTYTSAFDEAASRAASDRDSSITKEENGNYWYNNSIWTKKQLKDTFGLEEVVSKASIPYDYTLMSTQGNDYLFEVISNLQYDSTLASNAIALLKDFNANKELSNLDKKLDFDVSEVWENMVAKVEAPNVNYEDLQFTHEELQLTEELLKQTQTSFLEFYEKNKDNLEHLEQQQQKQAFSASNIKELNNLLQTGLITEKQYLNAFETVQANEIEVESEDIILYTEHLMRMAALEDEVSQNDEIGEHLANNAKAAEAVAKSALRAKEGISNIKDNIEKWTKVLKPANRELMSYAEANKELREALADLLGVSEDAFRDSFLENAEYLNLMKQAAEGSEEALEKLREAAFNEIVVKILIDNDFDETQQQQLLKRWQDFSAWFKDVKVGISLDDSNVAGGLANLKSMYSQLVKDSGMTVDQVNNVLAGIGVKPVYKTEQVPADVAVPKYKTITHHSREIFARDGDGNPLKWDDTTWTETVESGSEIIKGSATVTGIGTEGQEPVIEGENVNRTDTTGTTISTSTTSSGGSAPPPQTTNSNGEPVVNFKAGEEGNRKYVLGRDGNYYYNDETGKTVKYEGHLQEKIVTDANGNYEVVTFEKIGGDFYDLTDSEEKGGGGGSDNTPEDYSDQKKELDEVIERYEHIENILQDIEKDVDRLNKDADRLWGANRIKALTEVNKKLEEQKEALLTKQDEIKANLAIDQQAASAAGFTFDKEGRINNRDAVLTAVTGEWNSVVDKLNSYSTKEEQDKYKESEEYKNAEKKIEELKETATQYEETRDLYIDTQDAVKDLTYAIQDNNQLIISDEYEVGKTLTDVAGQIADTIAIELEGSLDVVSAKIKTYYDQIKTSTTNILKTTSYTDTFFNKTLDANISAADKVENYQTVISDYISSYSALNELLEQIYQSYSVALETGADKINQTLEEFDIIVNKIDHYRNLLGLIGKENDIALNKKLNDSTIEAEMANINSRQKYMTDLMLKRDDIIKKQNEMFAGLTDPAKIEEIKSSRLYTTLEENKQTIDDYLREEEDAIMSSTENIFTLLQKQLNLNLEEAKQKFSKALAGMEREGREKQFFGSLEQMTNQFDRQTQIQEIFLTKTNKMYETSKLIRQAQLAMDKTDNELSKKKYQGYIKLVENLQGQTEISQEELDIAQARYEVLQAQITLEEAQHAKSVVRLTRNAEGNWGYMYTADEDKISEAEQKLEDAENKLYNTGLDAAKSYAEQRVEILKSMYDELTEVQEKAASGEYTEEEANAEIARIREFYQRKYEIAEEQYGKGMDVLGEFNATTELVYGDDLITSKEFKKIVDNYINDSDEAMEEWKTAIEKYREEISIPLDNLDKTLSDLSDSVKYTGAELDKDIETLTTLINKVYKMWYEPDEDSPFKIEGEDVSIVEFISSALGSIATNMNLAYSHLDTEGQKIDFTPSKVETKVESSEGDNGEASSGQTSGSGGTSSSITTPKYSGGEAVSAAVPPPKPSGGGTKPPAEEEDKTPKKEDFKTEDFYPFKDWPSLNVLPTQSDFSDAYEIYQEYKKLFPNDKTPNMNDKIEEGEFVRVTLNNNTRLWKEPNGTVGPYSNLQTGSLAVIADDSVNGLYPIFIWDNLSMINTIKEDGEEGKNNKSLFGWVSKEALSSYDTGGYTGQWGPEGKLATLHEKEIILNKYDTENFLQAIEMVRSIADFIEQNASTSALGLLGYGNLNIPYSKSDEILQQEVTIHADFPNVQNHTEIEEAFNNLLNTASQYANRKK